MQRTVTSSWSPVLKSDSKRVTREEKGGGSPCVDGGSQEAILSPAMHLCEYQELQFEHFSIPQIHPDFITNNIMQHMTAGCFSNYWI